MFRGWLAYTLLVLVVAVPAALALAVSALVLGPLVGAVWTVKALTDARARRTQRRYGHP